MQKELPAFFIEKLKEQYGSDIADSIIESFSNELCTTLRVNTLKTNIDNVKACLKESEINYKDIAYNEMAIVLEPNQEEKVQDLEIYKNGEIYMQSLSSMLPPIVLNPRPKETILDMCAAPGGKTTEIAILTKNEALITACERNAIRAERLKYNIEKQGAKGIYVIVRDARDLDNFLSFDKILLDAPCSGSGTLHNSEKCFDEYLLKKTQKTQEIRLNKALKLLKPGGELVYSTCSILKEENENNIKKVLNKNIELVPIDLDVPKLDVTIEGIICIKPTSIYEGFFMAKLKKIS